MTSNKPINSDPDEGHEHAAMPEEARRLEGPFTLLDGTTIHVRPIRPDDTERLRAFHARLSPDTIVQRFFSYVPRLTEEAARRFTHVDYANRLALVATTGTGPDEQIIGVVRYDRISPDTAEVAFVVEDRFQGHGISTGLLRRLAPYARAHGITTLVAITMATNVRMLEVLRNVGFPSTVRFQGGGEIEVALQI